MSYSRHDAPLVGPLTQLLRATGGAVFRDTESIAPGTKWRVAIAEAIESAQTVLVFWCAHSARSAEVRAEYQQAMALGRPVVPVRLDWSDLPDELAEYQAIDLSGALGPHLTEARGVKGREGAYVLRRLRESELEEGANELARQLETMAEKR